MQLLRKLNVADNLVVLGYDDRLVVPLGNVNPNNKHGVAPTFPINAQTVPHVLMSHTLYRNLRRMVDLLTLPNPGVLFRFLLVDLFS